MKLGLSTRIQLYWREILHRRHFWFAHYPDCEQFAAYLLRLGKWRLCLGCLLFWSGFGSGALVALINNKQFSVIYGLMGGSCLIIALTVIDIYRPFTLHLHRLLRFCGGAALSFFLVWTWLPPASLWKLALLLIALLGFRYLSRIRTQHMTDPCLACRYYSPAVICPGVAARMAMEKRWLEKANRSLAPYILHLEQQSSAEQ